MRKLAPRSFPIILAYHTLDPPDFLKSILGIRYDSLDFEQQIRYLSSHHPIISMDEFLRWFSGGGSIPENAVMVTFDDGYRDIIDIALPLFRELSIPATVFLTTGCIGTGKSLWTNILYNMLYHSNCKNISLFSGKDTPLNLDLCGSTEEIASGVRKLTGALKRMDDRFRNDELKSLAKQLGFSGLPDPHESLPMLSWEQVKMLSENHFTMGSHSVCHPILSECDLERQSSEIADSRKAIEANCGTSCRVFAYPNGQPEDFTEETQRLVELSGYEAAFAFFPGVIHPGRNRYSIYRHPVFDVPLATFAAALTKRKWHAIR
ncbi:polysaccharide deacetylase family protein [bacterium]|nr:polysaccharide deacetylase family protein [candidate division CSSED10-310 bacterium]